MDMLNCLGNWNPQLLREIKGKLKVRLIVLSLASSLSVQLILLLIVRLGFETPPNFLDSKLWWTDVFVGSSIIGPFALIVIGPYWLIDDLVKEERRGTLSFIRLSPQSAQSIFLGKLLGVPILLYLSILFALPLHLASGILAGNSFWKVLAYDAACLASVFFFYSWALLSGLLASRQQPKTLYSDGISTLAEALFGFSILCYSLIIDNLHGDVLKSFSPLTLLPHLSGFRAEAGFSLELTFFGTLSFIVGTCLTISWWIWKLLERGFRNPNVPLVAKKQSYGISACVALLLFGYLLQGQAPIPLLHQQLVEVLDLPFIYCLWLFSASVPKNQSCIDWVRSRHTSRQRQQNLWVNLLVNEKSPVTLAIALNSCILLTPIVGWVLFWPTQADRGSAILAIVLNASLISLYTGIFQVWKMMLIPVTQRLKLTLALLGGAMIFFLLFTRLFPESSASIQTEPVLWLFTPNAWIAAKYASPVVIMAIAIAQGGLIGLLNLKLTRQLHQAGESASKALLAPSR